LDILGFAYLSHWVWKFVLDGFLAMAATEDSDMELAVWKKVW
jgi:hypothetical protein